MPELRGQPAIWTILPYLRAGEPGTERNRMASGGSFFQRHHPFRWEIPQFGEIPAEKTRLPVDRIYDRTEGQLPEPDPHVCIHFGPLFPCPVLPEFVPG